jgi:hypothetical protein
MVANAGDRPSRGFLDFLRPSIEGDNIRIGYYEAVC